MLMGLQLFLAGYMAELVGRNSPTRNTYLVSNYLGLEAPCKSERE